MNRRADSMDLMALLIAKTVFLDEILWKYMSRACRWLKERIDIFFTPNWIISDTWFIRISWKSEEKTLAAPKPKIPRAAVCKSTYEAIARAFTVTLRKNGLAIASDLERTRSAVDLYNRVLVSYSKMIGLR